MRTSFIRSLGAAALAGGLVMGGAVQATAAPAETTGTVLFKCSMPDFGDSADFDYEAEVKIKGLREAEGSSPVTLLAELSDLPGVVPEFISMMGQPVSVELGVSVGGTDATLAVTGTTDVNPKQNGTKEPVSLPGDIRGTVATSETDIVVEVKSFDFDVAGVAGGCTAEPVVAMDALTPEVGAVPTPTPTPTPKPTPSETPDPEPTEEPKDQDKAGKPAEGKIGFTCLLKPFNTNFPYNADVSVAGVRSQAGDTNVSIAGTFGKIPGIAPVPIDGGQMTVTVKGTMGGEAVTLTGKSTVNAPANAEVPVPRLETSMSTDADEVDVKIDTFDFAFEPMMGLTITADCKADSGASLGAMTIGVGSLDDVAPPGGSDGNGGGGAGAGAATLPRTGGGDAMPVITLWALAFGMAGAGLLVWMPRRIRES